MGSYIHFIRHGITEGIVNKWYYGSVDLPLIEEGYVREIISKVQNMRKDSGFEVMDHIRVSILGNELLAKVVKDNEDAIATKVLADSFSFTDTYSFAKEWNVNGQNVTITIEKCN